MFRLSMPAAVRLLLCALLLGAASTSATPAGQPAGSVAQADLPITNSFSGYIIAVG